MCRNVATHSHTSEHVSGPSGSSDCRDARAILNMEFHHRLKNTIQLSASLLGLQEKRTKVEALRNQFSAARRRLLAMASFHDLICSENSGNIPMDSYLSQLCAVFDCAERGISLELSAEDIYLDADRAPLLALLISELVANAVKHAFIDGRPGSIKICLRKCDGDALRLIVEDDGIGHKSSNSTGLGSVIIAAMISQLKGSMHVVQNQRNGYAVEVYIP